MQRNGATSSPGFHCSRWPQLWAMMCSQGDLLWSLAFCGTVSGDRAEFWSAAARLLA